MPRIFMILGVVTFAVFALLFYQYSAQRRDEVQAQQFETVMTEKMQQLYLQAQDWTTPIHLQTKDQRLSGDYQLMADTLLSYWVNSAEARNRYLRELEKSDWVDFLDVVRLDKDRKQNYKETEQMLVQVRKISQQYQQQTSQIKQQTLEKVEQLPIRTDLRKAMLTKLERSQKSDEDQAIFQLELQILEKAEAMFEMLKKYKWVKQGETILFYEDAQVKQFNTLYQEVLQLNAEIEKIEQKNVEALKQEL